MLVEFQSEIPLSNYIINIWRKNLKITHQIIGFSALKISSECTANSTTQPFYKQEVDVCSVKEGNSVNNEELSIFE